MTAIPIAKQIGATHVIGPTEQATDLLGCPAQPLSCTAQQPLI
jgi:hypothetical protein